MAKLVMEGMTIEGSVEELKEYTEYMMAKNQEGERKTPHVEEEPRVLEVGDYVRFKNRPMDITVGKEYEVVSHEGCLAVIDDVDDPRIFLLQSRDKYEIRGVDYEANARKEDEYKKGDIVKHGSAWFGRIGIGEVDRAFNDGSYLVKGVNNKGVEVKFFLRPDKMTLIATVENREDIEGTE